MGRLKELLMQANLDLDMITVSKAEAQRLLHQASKESFTDAALTKDQQQVQQPA